MDISTILRDQVWNGIAGIIAILTFLAFAYPKISNVLRILRKQIDETQVTPSQSTQLTASLDFISVTFIKALILIVTVAPIQYFFSIYIVDLVVRGGEQAVVRVVLQFFSKLLNGIGAALLSCASVYFYKKAYKHKLESMTLDQHVVIGLLFNALFTGGFSYINFLIELKGTPQETGAYALLFLIPALMVTLTAVIASFPIFGATSMILRLVEVNDMLTNQFRDEL